MWMLHVILVVVLTFTPQVDSLTGHVCPERNTRYVTRYRSQSQAYQQKYYTDCGFWNWQSCTRWRTRYTVLQVSYTSAVYYYVDKCCSGWRIGPTSNECGIHKKLPTVVSCPTGKTVTGVRETPLTKVTWPAPSFKEAHNFGLTVSSTYGREWADLPWGSTTITYTATSKNNNMQVTCTFKIRVNPPDPLPEIDKIVGNRSLYLTDKSPVTLICRANHGTRAMVLAWLFGGQYISNGTRYHTKPNGFENYVDAVNELTFLPGKEHHNRTIICRGLRPGDSRYYYDSVLLNVSYDPEPVLDFCPADINITTNERFVTLGWPWPRFSEPKGEELVIKSSVASNESQEFGWGTNEIQYIAENPRSKKTKTCLFHRNIWPHTCNHSLESPTQGAIVCGKWDTFMTIVCQGFCQDNWDVLPQDRVPQYWVCGATGRWYPKVNTFHCLAKKDVLLSANRIGDHNRYFAGNCTAKSTKTSLRDTFLRQFKNSPFKTLCRGHTDCAPTTVDIRC